MKIRPLYDRILVKRIEEQNKTAGGLFIPDTAKEKPQEALVVAVGNGKIQEDGIAAQAGGEGGRQDPVLQVLGQRDQDRRHRAPDPARGRHPRGDRLSAGQSTFKQNARQRRHKSWQPKRSFLRRAPAQSIASGLNILANTVKVTLGPRGRNVIIEKTWGSPTVTKDGVTVAKEIELEDKLANMGAQMVKEVASKTSDIAGDGTTTATVLAQAIYTEGSKLVAAGHNPMDIKRGIDAAVAKIVENLKEQAKPTKGKTEIAQVGTISANGETVIGDILAEAMEKVGKEGVITVEEAKSMETTLDVVEGMQFDRGYLSPYFVTDAERMEVGARGRVHPRQREEALEHEGPAAAARAGGQGAAARC